MNLGLQGRNALVCASSKGLGRACAESLAREGAAVTMVARGIDALEQAADEIRRATGAQVTMVAADITPPEGRSAALAACAAPDILVTNAGGPKPGDFRDWERAQWIAALDANMLTPIALIRAPAEFGDACAWVCSAQAGYMTGQNLLLDGGNYQGTF